MAWHINGFAPEILSVADQLVPQCNIALALGQVADQVFLAGLVGSDYHIVGHFGSDWRNWPRWGGSRSSQRLVTALQPGSSIPFVSLSDALFKGDARLPAKPCQSGDIEELAWCAIRL